MVKQAGAWTIELSNYAKGADVSMCSGKSTQLPSFVLEDQLAKGQHCKIVGKSFNIL